jgi:hypothetical protein
MIESGLQPSSRSPLDYERSLMKVYNDRKFNPEGPMKVWIKILSIRLFVNLFSIY